jgi:hypothetical protein
LQATLHGEGFEEGNNKMQRQHPVFVPLLFYSFCFLSSWLTAVGVLAKSVFALRGELDSEGISFGYWINGRS